MAINPTQVTVEGLFGTKKYFIDFYQRDYKWNDKQQKYKPIRSLLDDIFYRFDLNYRENVDINEETISRYDWYYLNSFMTNTVGGNTYIVDGQQRLTTLAVLIICLLKIGTKLGIDKGKQQYLEKKVCDYDANGNIVFWMGFTDRVRALKVIYEGTPDNEPKLECPISVAEQNIIEAYKTIYAYLDARLKNSHVFDAFRLYLVKRVYLISIDVDESKDVAMAFEVINDRGIPLKPYEILKGKILGVIAKNEVHTYVDIWEKAVNQITDQYSDVDIVDDFLSIYFQSKHAETALNHRDLNRDNYHKTIYLEEFDKFIGLKNGGAAGPKCITNIKRFVKETLPFFSDLYCRIIEDSYAYLSDEKIAHAWFNSINEQDYQYYLIFAAINPGDSELEAKYRLVTREFDRLYTMLNLTGSYHSNDFAAAVILMGKEIRGKCTAEIKKVFDSTLIEMINKAQERTDITDPFRYELFVNTDYRMLSKRFLRYFFARIDRFIASESGLPNSTYYSLISRAKGKDVFHIEHILANDENHYNAGLFTDEEHFIAQRNRLGGLLLLKGADNQSSGNELYKDKLKTYVGNGTLFAQTLLPDFSHSNTGFRAFAAKYNLEFKTYNQYDAATIEERQRLLFEMVKIIWE